MQIDILGASYTIETKSYEEDKEFHSCDGYCNTLTKGIVICDFHTSPEWNNSSDSEIRMATAKVIRHEIVHAFLYESGLASDSSPIEAGWARNEEMVDWFAIQGPKIVKAWQEAEALS